jgi:hypothetical protein
MWNEFAMWCLAGFSLSGAALWLTRPEPQWTIAISAAGIGAFILLWSLLR